jgi:hypothetical protein
MCSSTAIAIVFQNVNNYFGLLGGTAGVMMAGGIPAICYYKLKENKSRVDILLLFICVVVTIISVLGAFLSFIDSFY